MLLFLALIVAVYSFLFDNHLSRGIKMELIEIIAKKPIYVSTK